MSTGPSIERVEEVLTSLLVGSGGKLSRKEIVPGWSVLFSEYRNGGDEFPYSLTLSYRSKSKTVGLRPDDVFTKGKSPWRRDNAWRLKPETVSRLAPGIAQAIAANIAHEQKDNPTRKDKLLSELSHAQADFRFWARQEHRLSRDEYRQKKLAEQRVREIETDLAKETRQQNPAAWTKVFG